MTLEELTIESEGGIVCASLTGEVDMSNVPRIRRLIGEAVSNQAIGLVLDLTEVDYLDSAGMQLVHSLRADLRSHGQRLALVIPDDSPINDALRLAGVDWAAHRIAHRDEAAAAFGSGST